MMGRTVTRLVKQIKLFLIFVAVANVSRTTHILNKKTAMPSLSHGTNGDVLSADHTVNVSLLSSFSCISNRATVATQTKTLKCSLNVW